MAREKTCKTVNGEWCPVEDIKLNGELEPIKLHNTVFNEIEGSLMRFSVGGYPMDLIISIWEGKIQFTISCAYGNSKDEFTNNNINECLNWARKWFEKR